MSMLSDYTLKEHIIGWSQIIGFIGFGAWAIYAMLITAPIGMIVMGGLIWWGIFAAETAFNGGKSDIESLFEYATGDFKNNFGSGAWEHRMKLSLGDEEWAKMYPGKIHCIFTHVFLPLVPLMSWMVVV